jgi:hypothetical protein
VADGNDDSEIGESGVRRQSAEMSEGKFCVYSHVTDGQVFYVGSRSRRRTHSRVERVQNGALMSGGIPISMSKFTLGRTNDRAEAITIETALIDRPSCNSIKTPGLPHMPGSTFKLVTAIGLKPVTKAALKQAAETDGRSMMNLVELVLEDWLRTQGFLK